MSGKLHALRKTTARAYRRVSGADLRTVQRDLQDAVGRIHSLSASVDLLAQHAGIERIDAADVGIISDFRLPGGTTASIAQEVLAQSAAGLRTALIHAQSGITSAESGFSDHIREALSQPNVHLITGHQKLHVKVLILRHPAVMATLYTRFPEISADHVIMIANHPAVNAAGVEQYDVHAANEAMSTMFGSEPLWAPISGVVRESLQSQRDHVRLTADDWPNIFGELPRSSIRRVEPGRVPVIGRHSRPHRMKWPAEAQEILAAYPAGSDVNVTVLGGADTVVDVLGEIPSSWTVHPFGALDSEDFLSGVDFWVFMHHHQWREAFGRAIMEALAAGCVVVLPAYLEQIYSDAAVYCTAAEVQTVVQRLWNDPEQFADQSEKGRMFAQRYGPHRHIDRLKNYGVQVPSE